MRIKNEDEVFSWNQIRVSLMIEFDRGFLEKGFVTVLILQLSCKKHDL